MNDPFHDAGRIAAINLLQLRGHAASAIAASASGRFVRILPVQPQRSEGPELLDLPFKQRAANDGVEPIV